jgi:hypothetical protein
MAAKVDIAGYREADLEAAHADPDEDIQEDIKINHVRKNITCVGNLDAD